MIAHRSLIALLAAGYTISATPGWAGVTILEEGFEGPTSWFAGPGAGFDRGLGLAHTGEGNAWVRNLSGWTAVNLIYNPSAPAGSECAAQAWIRMSPTVTDGYFSVRSFPGEVGPVISEVKLVGPGPANPAHAGYNAYSFGFRHTGGPMLFYIGNWGNGGDSWLQIDDVVIRCSTPF